MSDGALVEIPKVDNLISNVLSGLEIRRKVTGCFYYFLDVIPITVVPREYFLKPSISMDEFEEFVINTRAVVDDVRLHPIVALKDYATPLANERIEEMRRTRDCVEYVYGVSMTASNIDAALTIAPQGVPLDIVKSEISGELTLSLEGLDDVYVQSECFEDDFRVGPIDDFNTLILPTGRAEGMLNDEIEYSSPIGQCRNAANQDLDIIGFVLSVGFEKYIVVTRSR